MDAAPSPLPLLPARAESRVWVALSGGLDSTALLHRLARDASHRRHGLAAIHVHHGLQLDADAWAAHCSALCATLDVPLQVRHVQVDTTRGEGTEAAARARASAGVRLCHGCRRHPRHGASPPGPGGNLPVARTACLRSRWPGVDAAVAGVRPGWQWRPLLETPREAICWRTPTGSRWNGSRIPATRTPTSTATSCASEILPLLRRALAARGRGLRAQRGAERRNPRTAGADWTGSSLAAAATADPARLERRAAARSRPARSAHACCGAGSTHSACRHSRPKAWRRSRHDLLDDTRGCAGASSPGRTRSCGAGVACCMPNGSAAACRCTGRRRGMAWRAIWSCPMAALLSAGRRDATASRSPLRLIARQGGERIALPGRYASACAEGRAAATRRSAVGTRQHAACCRQGDGALLAAGDVALSAELRCLAARARRTPASGRRG